MGVIDIAKKLKSLASVPANRHRIVKDQGMLPTLTAFLENGDSEIVRVSIEVIELLSQEPSNHAAIRNEPGLMSKIESLIAKHKKMTSTVAADTTTTVTNTTNTTTDISSATHSNNDNAAESKTTVTNNNEKSTVVAEPLVVELAEKIVANVREQPKAVAANTSVLASSSSSSLSSSSSSVPTVEFVTPVKKSIETVNLQSIFAKPNGADVKQELPINNYVLYVKGLHGDDQRDKVEAALLGTSGVLSFWFDIYQQKAEIRARCEEKVLIQAIKSVGFVAVAWRGEGSPHSTAKANGGDSCNSASAASAANNNNNDDGYLDENDNPQHSYGSGGWLGTLSIFGKAPPKKKNDNSAASSGFLGKIKSSWWG